MKKNEITEFFGNIENTHISFIKGWKYSKIFNLKMTNLEDLKDYIRKPKIALNPKYQSFFNEVYKLPSIEINAKIHKLTKGFNRLNQLIDMYNLYNAYVHFESNPSFLTIMNDDEFTLFKRQYDVVNFNDLKLITLYKNDLIFESYKLLKYPNIDVYKRQTFSDILENLIQSEYTKIQPQQTIELEQNKIVNSKEVNKKQAKTVKPKKEFKDFFNTDVKIEVIEKIQKDFKDSIGKKIAYLIYLLETDLKIISYSLNGKNDSRKHFVESMMNKTISMQGINKYFEPNDVKLNIFRFEKASDYIHIKKELLKTIT